MKIFTNLGKNLPFFNVTKICDFTNRKITIDLDNQLRRHLEKSAYMTNLTFKQF